MPDWPGLGGAASVAASAREKPLYLAAIIAVADLAEEVVPSNYRLPPRTGTQGETCRAGTGSDVVICGRRLPGNYRVAPLVEAPRENLMRSYGVGGGVTVTPEISQTIHGPGSIWNGLVDRRVTVRVRVPF